MKARRTVEAEVSEDRVLAARLAASKDERFRSLALPAAEGPRGSGKPQGEDAPDA